jgi:hypothetical protein
VDNRDLFLGKDVGLVPCFDEYEYYRVWITIDEIVNMFWLMISLESLGWDDFRFGTKGKQRYVPCQSMGKLQKKFTAEVT